MGCVFDFICNGWTAMDGQHTYEHVQYFNTLAYLHSPVVHNYVCNAINDMPI